MTETSKHYTPIVGTLGYILSEDHQDVLLVHRNFRDNDQHLGKYNGLGGKLEPYEDVATGMIREIKEEADIDVVNMQMRGTINWTGFGPNGEDWLGFIFLITKWQGIPLSHNEEGELGWHPLKGIIDLPMWEGDRHFLPLVFDQDPRIFHGIMPYDNDKPKSWNFVRI
ncbi:MAG: 8-oxo-dGTP diphosphatase [Planctomycetes bacterium]|nr:8-oxo-dGTP diphosphatase [Planctomycetota bacterium]